MSESIIVYVEKEKFLRSMMEKAVTSAGMRIYTYGDSDCLHFIEDLKPKVLILDAQTIDDGFVAKISTHIPIILIGTPEALLTVTKATSARMEKPIAPFELVAQISQLLSY